MKGKKFCSNVRALCLFFQLFFAPQPGWGRQGVWARARTASTELTSDPGPKQETHSQAVTRSNLHPRNSCEARDGGCAYLCSSKPRFTVVHAERCPRNTFLSSPMGNSIRYLNGR